MKDLLRYLEEMTNDEEDGYQKYKKLSVLFEDLGDISLAEPFKLMALDEQSHKEILKDIIQEIKINYSRLEKV